MLHSDLKKNLRFNVEKETLPDDFYRDTCLSVRLQVILGSKVQNPKLKSIQTLGPQCVRADSQSVCSGRRPPSAHLKGRPIESCQWMSASFPSAVAISRPQLTAPLAPSAPSCIQLFMSSLISSPPLLSQELPGRRAVSGTTEATLRGDPCLIPFCTKAWLSLQLSEALCLLAPHSKQCSLLRQNTTQWSHSVPTERAGAARFFTSNV